jgi:4,5-dihydroxyphthalate decarboxylase
MAETITLHTAFAGYPHVRGLKDGSVASARIRFDFEAVPVITRAFRRMVRTLDFDLCEIALTTLAQAHAFGKPIQGLPIVVMRGFHHAALVCSVKSVISGPEDLWGKKIGVRAWSQTTGVWVRGILLDEYGVDHRDITRVTEEDAHLQEYVDPPNVIRIAPGQELKAMLLAGEIDAGIALAGIDPASVRPVIDGPVTAASAWFAKTGVYPVNHLLCVKTAMLEAVILRISLPGLLNAILRTASRNPPGERPVPVRQTLVGRPHLECPKTTESQWQAGQNNSRTEKRTGTLRHGFVQLWHPDHSASSFGRDLGRAN